MLFKGYLKLKKAEKDALTLLSFSLNMVFLNCLIQRWMEIYQGKDNRKAEKEG